MSDLDAQLADETNTLLKAILALMIEERESRNPNLTQASVFLSDLGMTNHLISQVTGKSPDAIRMSISRAKKTQKKRTQSEDDIASVKTGVSDARK